MKQSASGAGSGMAMPGHSDHSGEGHEAGGMAMRELPFGVATAWVVATFVVLGLAVLVTNYFVALRF